MSHGASPSAQARVFERSSMLDAAHSAREPWDVVIVGGGATGLGCAVDAAARGYRTLLLERVDFAQGTSSRSTKLVHGGVRYLKQGNVSLVFEALRERGLLLKNAPHLVRDLSFVIPAYRRLDLPFYAAGLKAYDLLAGRSGFGGSRWLSTRRALELAPTLNSKGLVGGILYHDGQFDDSRLAINLAQTAAEQGAVILNYVRVAGLLKADGKVAGVEAVDEETGEAFEIRAKVVVNATGVFADDVRRMDDANARRTISPSQGVHIVLDRSFLPGDTAIMVPKTDDGRVLFAIPWHDSVVVGTTDTPMQEIAREPRPLAEELEFLLDHAGRYLSMRPTAADVRSAFAGLRPLVSDDSAEGNTAEGGGNTAKLSRDHTLTVSPSGLVSIIGGKWTTYREMAEQTIDRAAKSAGLASRPSPTKALRIHGHTALAASHGDWAFYGSDAVEIEALIRERPDYAERVHERLRVHIGQVVWAARQEMARSVEDVLSRRTRCLILDAKASVAAAPRVAAILANELGRDAAWERSQVESFAALAKNYLPSTTSAENER